MTSQQERAPLPTRTPDGPTNPGQPSSTLSEISTHGWNAFLARTGPLPGEDEPEGTEQ
ncbi:hypothetical protein ACODT5_28690 [Streptomyces sp. 5.8]|uniref:hypothetical protein n=1 Tax=Streptomyces sp. 5.8 TaxID=3406571 RepID=UPI003BB7C28C